MTLKKLKEALANIPDEDTRIFAVWDGATYSEVRNIEYTTKEMEYMDNHLNMRRAKLVTIPSN